MTLLAALVLVPAAAALEVRSGEQQIVAEGEIVDDDLYVLAEHVRVAGHVRGDVVAVGRDVEVTGRVDGNLTAVAQRLDVGGEVHDLRGAARVVRLSAPARIGGDLLVAAEDLHAAAGSEVGRDVAIVARDAALAASIGSDVVAVARGLVVDGPILGGLQATVGDRPAGWGTDAVSVPSGLTLGPRAVIAGDLDYAAPAELRRSPRAITGAAIHYTPVRTTATAALDVLGSALRRFLAVLGVVAIALVLAPERFATATELALLRTWQSIAVGLATAIGWGIAAIAAAVVVGFLAGGLAVMGFGGLSALVIGTGAITELGAAVALALVGGWLAPGIVAVGLAERVTPRLVVAVPLAALALGVVHVIPGIGVAVGIALGLVGLGALVGSLAGWEAEQFVSDRKRASDPAAASAVEVRS